METAKQVLPSAYLLTWLEMLIPLFEEARDALTALTEAQRKVHGISSTLADRMDFAGTYNIDAWLTNHTLTATDDTLAWVAANGCVPFPPALIESIAALVGDTVVDLDAPLDPKDE